MKNIISSFIFFIMIFLGSNTEAKLDILMNGVGLFRCGELVEYLKSEDEDIRMRFIQWVAGYIGAYNMYIDENQRIIPPEYSTTTLWIETYCKNNPTKGLVNATQGLIEELGGEATKYEWKR